MCIILIKLTKLKIHLPTFTFQHIWRQVKRGDYGWAKRWKGGGDENRCGSTCPATRQWHKRQLDHQHHKDSTLSWYLILIPITWYSNYLGLKKWWLHIFHHQGKRRPSTKAGFLSSIANYAAQLLLAAVVTVSGHWVIFSSWFFDSQKQDTPSTYMRSKIQVVSENVVEDYWEQVKARHIHNYVAYNNTRSATNSSTNLTKLTSRQSRRPRHPVISPFRMPPRGWPRYDTSNQSYSLCHSFNGENKENTRRCAKSLFISTSESPIVSRVPCAFGITSNRFAIIRG